MKVLLDGKLSRRSQADELTSKRTRRVAHQDTSRKAETRVSITQPLVVDRTGWSLAKSSSFIRDFFPEIYTA